ncbi:putative monooxygenase [Aspergillus sclerotiicarbonarius CBS 121057]|uniref:Putative monooxygenase n=1 Tax=Aspergillus sclerotiicarbonarius (strain CBS 121057 / IBT 28362) TaxID=1448318 RepID=A0A319F6W8_ASPSB|nr:putative monooxygenase [Aspergillus sclerotiicarbonarius CBS 121057]
MGLPSRPPCRVLIIGGGISGLAMACKLKRTFNLNDYCIYDRQSSLGGTWWANTYPGCAVDVPGFTYTFSFAPNPDFTRLFPSQEEILNYLSTVAIQHGVDRHFTGHTEWTGAVWQEKTQTWIVTLQDLNTGQSFTQECQILISAVGGIVNPHEFKMPGVEDFQGEIIHTARWRHDVDLTNKHVAVIGNGASAIQLVPAIADKAKSITQFMRTPHHIVPATNHDISPTWRAIFHHIPILLYLLRLFMLLYMETAFFQFQNTPNGKTRRQASSKASQEYVQNTAPEQYWDLLIPKYEFGCKRRLFDHTYLTTLHQTHKVTLTNDPITSLTQNSINTHSGSSHPVDIIILATGFTLTQYTTPLHGRNNLTRAQHWDIYGHKATFKTVAMHGFPNFFYVLGPNSGRLYTSTVGVIESAVDLILTTITPILNNEASKVEVKEESERLFDQQLHDAISGTVHGDGEGGCSSYFVDRDTGKNWFVYPWNSLQMWMSMYGGSGFGRRRDWGYGS